nr:hypothetical protein A4A49_06179 [Ipomoea batatas]
MEYRRQQTLQTQSKSSRTFPPRRGQVMDRVLKTLVRSASILVPASGNSKKKAASSGALSPVSWPTPNRNPSGYDSGADSDRSYR